MKERVAKVKPTERTRDETRAEYDFSDAVQGKSEKRLSQGSYVVVLDPDVAAHFSKSEAVNKALRDLLRVAAETERLTRSCRRSKTRAC